MDRQTDGLKNRDIDENWKEGQAGEQTDRQTGSHINGHFDRQTY